MLSGTVIPIAEFPAGTVVSDNDICQIVLSNIVKKKTTFFLEGRFRVERKVSQKRCKFF